MFYAKILLVGQLDGYTVFMSKTYPRKINICLG